MSNFQKVTGWLWIFYFIFTLIGIAVIIVFWGAKQKKKPFTAPKLTDWDRKFMAYHEAGHAICSYYLPQREKLILITIDPSSKAFGMIQTESRAHHNETKISLMSTLSTLLAGHLAEKMLLGEQTTSSIHDLKSVQSIATDMVLKFGMGKKTGVHILGEENIKLCDQIKEIIQYDIRNIIQEAESDAEKILNEHSDQVVTLAKQLLQYNTMNKTDIMLFFDKNRRSKI